MLLAAACTEQPTGSRYHPFPTKIRQRKGATFRASFAKQAGALTKHIQAREAYQVDGSGLAVAVLDSGLNIGHVDFAGAGRIPAQVNFTADDNGDATKVSDGFGHGSNVGGIVVAHGTRHQGVAPGANIIPLKILDNDGGGEPDAVEKALDWVFTNRDTYHVSVAVLSFADNGNYASDAGIDAQFAGIRARIKKLRENRVPVVVAAGNLYHKFNPVPLGKKAEDMGQPKQGMCLPAVFRECISVGAVYDMQYPEPMQYPDDGALANKTDADWITPFSQRLHENPGQACRTDIFAPGGKTDSSGSFGPDSESVETGTSQAAPFVAGVILLMQQYHKQVANGKLPCVDDLESWLRTGGAEIEDFKNGNDNVVHTGLKFRRLNAMGALEQLKNKPCTH
jgi:subtilisin family serine protease